MQNKPLHFLQSHIEILYLYFVNVPGKASVAISHVNSSRAGTELSQLQEAKTEVTLKGATRTISLYHSLCRGGR